MLDDSNCGLGHSFLLKTLLELIIAGDFKMTGRIGNPQ